MEKITSPEIEEFWDFLCSELEILEDKKKQNIVREYGKRIAKQACEQCKFKKKYEKL